jgi:hypothetical protein
MKNYPLFFIAIVFGFTAISYAQTSARLNENSVYNNVQINSQNDLAVVSYHIEERVNMNFGSRITTYNVPSLDYIERKELGENNSRKITPKYGIVRVKLSALKIVCDKNPKQLFNSSFIKSVLVDTDVIAPRKRARPFVDIDVVGTYSRVIEKGYKSTEMIVKVADRHFFEGNLILAAKWYSELFENKSDFEAVYYYRYAQSLFAVDEIEKGKEMMKIFETKSL